MKNLGPIICHTGESFGALITKGFSKSSEYAYFLVNFGISFLTIAVELKSSFSGLKTQQSPVILDLCLRKTRPGKSRDYRDVIIFEKALFSKSFPLARKRKSGVFKFIRFEECFQKAPFSWWISVDDRPNRRNKAVFSNFSGVVWTLHESTVPIAANWRELLEQSFDWSIRNSVRWSASVKSFLMGFLFQISNTSELSITYSLKLDSLSPLRHSHAQVLPRFLPPFNELPETQQHALGETIVDYMSLLVFM